MSSITAMFIRVLKGLWRALDRVRKTLHFVFLLIVLLLVVAALVPYRPTVPRSAALVIAPQGALVDQLSGDPLDRALARLRGSPVREALARDIIEAIRSAAEDDRIKAVVLQLGGLTEAGLSKLQDIGDELLRFKTTGKRVIAVGAGYDQRQYYLAAFADDVYMHPMGTVLIDGFSRFLPYFKTALDKLYVDYNVWTVGEYKSFVEPYERDDMSPEDREASGVYLRGLWSSYQNDVAAARELPADSLQRYADSFAELLTDAGGDTARLAETYGLVDELLTRDVMRERIRDVVGPARNDPDDYSAISYEDYLAAERFGELPLDGGNKIAVVVASGNILDGTQPPGSVGGDTMARLVRDVANDDDVKALVLRVDSPGGSAFASAVILREIEVFQESGRPVVVSMGSVAASGGYWISMSGDEIWASPTTLTGSIGVGATLPTFQRTLDRLGIHVDGFGTTDLAGQYGPGRALGDAYRTMVQQSIEHTYDEFITKVASYRNRTPEQIDAVARGRVWTGSDALERGLVDRLGDLDDAIASAAELAGLEPDGYEIDYREPTLTLTERLAVDLSRAVMPAVEALGFQPRMPEGLVRLLEAASGPLEFLATFNDPNNVYAYCFCDVR